MQIKDPWCEEYARQSLEGEEVTEDQVLELASLLAKTIDEFYRKTWPPHPSSQQNFYPFTHNPDVPPEQ